MRNHEKYEKSAQHYIRNALDDIDFEFQVGVGYEKIDERVGEEYPGEPEDEILKCDAQGWLPGRLSLIDKEELWQIIVVQAHNTIMVGKRRVVQFFGEVFRVLTVFSFFCINMVRIRI
jgi:hypothetical protein